MEGLLLPILTKWASESHPEILAKEVIIFLIAFWIVKKWGLDKLTTHMKAIEQKFDSMIGKLDGVIGEVGGVKTALVNLESNHSREIDGVKQRLTIVEHNQTKKGENNG
jgi:hypothetical protein